MKACTTGQAARAVGVSRATVQVWIKSEKFRPPKTRLVGGKAVRLWTSADLNRLRAAKLEIYRKGRGRKAKTKR
jgi:DNA-binding transcriptional MerR regulator